MKISDITLRTRKIKDGRLSLHLHFTPAIRNPETMKLVHSESLGIYLWEHPTDVAQRKHNEDMLVMAEGIRSLRVQSLINEEYGFLDRNKKNADFLEYFRLKGMKYSLKCYLAYKHFHKWCGGKCTFGELTKEFCERYMEYMATKARALKPRYELLAPNTASAYFSSFKFILHQAYRERMMREDIADLLGNIPQREPHKEFLTLDEVQGEGVVFAGLRRCMIQHPLNALSTYNKNIITYQSARYGKKRVKYGMQ